MKVLEIGTGSGYQAAVLAGLHEGSLHHRDPARSSAERSRGAALGVGLRPTSIPAIGDFVPMTGKAREDEYAG